MQHIMTIGLTEMHRVKDLIHMLTAKDKPEYPDFLKKIHNWGAGISEGKYRGIAIYEFPDGKMYEAMLAIGKRYNYYASKGGYTYEVVALASEADALKTFM